MKYLEKDRKLIPFLEDWSWDDEEKWRFLIEKHGVFEREMNRQDNEQEKCSRDKLKSFKKLSKKRKTCVFRNLAELRTSHQDKSLNTLETKILKNLSKCFSQPEGPPTSKSRKELRKFLYNLVIGASTREQVAKLSRENSKNPEFWKIF